MSSDEMRREIAKYLLRHPEAKDTLEGIAEWWLKEQNIRIAVGEVRAVLKRLGDEEFLVRTELTGGREVYGLNPDKRSAIESLLDEK